MGAMRRIEIHRFGERRMDSLAESALLIQEEKKGQ
jgi:hypothetical protein